MIKYPFSVTEHTTDQYCIVNGYDSYLAGYLDKDEADSLVLRLNFLSEYSDEFLKEMGSLQHMITLHTRQKETLYEELDDANERYNKLVDWEY